MSSQITFPPLIPLIIFLSMMVGAPFVSNTVNLQDQTFDLEFIKSNLTQYIIGSLILSISCSLVLGLISYLILQKFNPSPKNKLRNFQ